MSRIFLSLLLGILLFGPASGYLVTLYAPQEIRAGAPLIVNGTTTFPAGTQFDIVLYKIQFTTPEEVAKRIIVVDDSKVFDASFATAGLQEGPYKVEVRFLQDPGSKLGSDSITLKQVTIIDRSGEIFLTVPPDQTFGEALLIEGYIPEFGVATLTLKISGPDGFSLPARNIRTTIKPGKTDGYFSEKISIPAPGNYYVEFYDPEGFMATIKYLVEKPVPQPQIPSVTPSLPPSPENTAGLPFPLAGMAGAILLSVLFAVRSRK